jgi:hypothetical protein
MNRLTLAAPLALSLVLVTAGTAGAQPPPPPVPDPEMPSGPYSNDLVDRPIMLPANMAEVGGYFWIPTSEGVSLFDVMSFVAQGRYSTGQFEPFAGLELLLIQPDGSNGSALPALFAGVRALLGPGVARATFTRYSPFDGFSIITLDGRFEYKQKLAPKLAVVAEGGMNFNLLSVDIGGMSDSGNSLFLLARGAGQAQLAPALALQGGLQLQLPLTSSDNVDTNTVTTLFGEGLYAMDKFDAFARLEIILAGEDTSGNSNSTTAFIVGAQFRPL